MPFAAPLALLFLAATLLVVGGCTAFLAACLHPLQNVLDTMLALWRIIRSLVQQPRICIDQRSAFFPSSAAVCAQHIRRLPKGELGVPDPSPDLALFLPQHLGFGILAPSYWLKNPA